MNTNNLRPKDGLDTPVLFLIFNRPELTRKVFEQIREAKPIKLFVAADGPRNTHPEDASKCEETRKVVLELVDWECEVSTLFRNENLGCGLGPYEAINWFFEKVDFGIILEDDCLPTNSFFHFCQFLLNKYENECRIMMISGLNLSETWDTTRSYHYCQFGGVWGWATWKRAWKGMDINIEPWRSSSFRSTFLKKNFKKKYHKSRISLYNNILSQISNNNLHVWDTQWTFHRLVNDGLSIVPSYNQIRNIGFSKSATHTREEPSWNPRKSFEIDAIIFNANIFIDKEYDEMHLSKTSKSLNLKALLLKNLKKAYERI